MDQNMKKVFQGDGMESLTGKEVHFNVYYSAEARRFMIRVTDVFGYPIPEFAHGMGIPLEGMVTISRGGMVTLHEEYFGTSVTISVPLGKILIDLPELGVRPVANKLNGYVKDYVSGEVVHVSPATVKLYGRIANILNEKGICEYNYFFS